jgi:hypothetical protein
MDSCKVWKKFIYYGLGMLLLIATGCVIEEPPCPKVEIPENEEGCSEYCDCSEQDLMGRAFRFTNLEVDEPAAFAEILNERWAGDIKNNIINVLFTPEVITEGSTSAFSYLRFHGGSGWRDPKEPMELGPPEGEPSESVVNSYCLLEGLTEPMEFEPYHGNQCIFKTIADSSLLFHPGPVDYPVLCAPELTPQNIIPIKSLKVRFGFNYDCTEIIDGYMEGCITIEDADKINMCMIGECEIDSGAADGCGGGWLNFGGLVSPFGVFPSCITEDGDQGYRLQGFFSATAIDDKYNPVSSADCSVY